MFSAWRVGARIEREIVRISFPDIIESSHTYTADRAIEMIAEVLRNVHTHIYLCVLPRVYFLMVVRI